MPIRGPVRAALQPTRGVTKPRRFRRQMAWQMGFPAHCKRGRSLSSKFSLMRAHRTVIRWSFQQLFPEQPPPTRKPPTRKPLPRKPLLTLGPCRRFRAPFQPNRRASSLRRRAAAGRDVDKEASPCPSGEPVAKSGFQRCCVPLLL